MAHDLLHNRYAAYLFDLDGTLIDTAPDLARAQNSALAAFGYNTVSEAETRHWVGHGAKVLMEKALTAQGAGHENLDAMHKHFLDYYAANICVASKQYLGVSETLTALRTAGAKLAVVTNKPEHLSRLLLNAIGMSAMFDTLVGGDTAAVPKPSAEPAELACQRLGISSPAEVLFVGDSVTDVGCARAFNCPVVCVSYGYNQGVNPTELGADVVIDNFNELVA